MTYHLKLMSLAKPLLYVAILKITQMYTATLILMSLAKGPLLYVAILKITQMYTATLIYI